MLEEADLGVGMAAAKEFLQAQAIAVIGQGQARLPAEEIAEIKRRYVDPARQFGLGPVLVRLGQQGERRFQLGVERAAIRDRLRSLEFIPQRP